METLGRDDDLVAVLRGQLHIEALLARVLTSKYPDSAELLDYVGFFDKIRLARRANLITGEMRTALQALGNLRNSFAHLPVKDRITEEDEADFLASLPPTVRDAAKDFIVRGREAHPRTATGQQTRTAIGLLYIFITTDSPGAIDARVRAEAADPQ